MKHLSLSCLSLLVCSLPAYGAYTGSILSQSRTSFTPGQQVDVTVTVTNTGDACEMALRAVAIPSG